MAAAPGEPVAEFIRVGREQIGVLGSQQPGTKEMKNTLESHQRTSEEGITRLGSARGRLRDKFSSSNFPAEMTEGKKRSPE